MSRTKDLAGQRFGRLLAIKKAGKNKQGSILWECLCNCGNIKPISSTNLRLGRIKSCGCLQREKSTKHGLSRTPTYVSWKSMIQRCNDTNHAFYYRYGGRGITVCERWLNFENFLEDMGFRPKDLTIERIDNNKGYYLDNCEWATRSRQSRNKSNKNNKTGVIGVNWQNNHKRYEVRIMANGKRYCIGKFKILEQAITARKKAEEIYWNEKFSTSY